VYRISSLLAASSIQELAYFSELVVIGQVISKEQIINTARDPNDPTKTDPRFFSINQVYKVAVDSILKGESANTILIVQNQGLLRTTTDMKPPFAEIQREAARNEQKTFIPLTLNAQYIFFLRRLDQVSYIVDGYQSTDLYAGVAEPWRFRIALDGAVAPETLLPNMNLCFPQKSLDEITATIKMSGQSYRPDENNPCAQPYPPPSANAPEAALTQTPYP
jgi:hypothetical protein